MAKSATIKPAINVTEVHKVTITLDRRCLRDLLKERGFDVPENAQINVRIPGGGDWSNTLLDITEECPVVVYYEETKSR